MAKAPKNDAPAEGNEGTGSGDVSTSTITIAGQEFTVKSPYTEGHTLNGAEARALNGLLHENLRNNFAKRVKDGMSSGQSRDDLQSALDQYSGTYTFEAKRVGGAGRTSDPYRREAKAIAKNAIIASLKRQGKDPKQIESAKLLDAIEKASQRDDIKELARRRVDEQKALAGDSLSELEAA
jgi:hypothetical protein